jgi:hypothetical protein
MMAKIKSRDGIMDARNDIHGRAAGDERRLRGCKALPPERVRAVKAVKEDGPPPLPEQSSAPKTGHEAKHVAVNRGKAVVCVSFFGKETRYASVSAAASACNLTPGDVRRQCVGKSKHPRKTNLRFRFEEGA